MSDDRIRELERRFKATGSIEDEAAWLRARLLAGDIDPARLRLAAQLGSRAAQILAPDAVHEPAMFRGESVRQLVADTKELRRFGGRAPIEAVFAAALHAMRDDPERAALLSAIARWLEHGRADTLDTIRTLGGLPADWEGGDCRADSHRALAWPLQSLVLACCEHERLIALGRPDLAELDAGRLASGSMSALLGEQSQLRHEARDIPPRPLGPRGDQTAQDGERGWLARHGAAHEALERELTLEIAAAIRTRLLAWALGPSGATTRAR